MGPDSFWQGPKSNLQEIELVGGWASLLGWKALDLALVVHPRKLQVCAVKRCASMAKCGLNRYVFLDWPTKATGTGMRCASPDWKLRLRANPMHTGTNREPDPSPLFTEGETLTQSSILVPLAGAVRGAKLNLVIKQRPRCWVFCCLVESASVWEPVQQWHRETTAGRSHHDKMTQKAVAAWLL